MFSDISDDKLLSATQLIESMKDLCACDVSVDELVGASEQFDVSSLYDDDAEHQHSDLISHLLLCSAWKVIQVRCNRKSLQLFSSDELDFIIDCICTG